MTHHIAQVNIAHMLAPTDSPVMAGFMARIDEINALAEKSAGFVWRLKGDEGNATAIRVFDNDMLIINLSVWESIEALYDFTYYSTHVELYRQRADWFHKMDTPMLALWWIPVGHVPTPAEAKAKLEHLTINGATPEAFTFKKRFAPLEF